MKIRKSPEADKFASCPREGKILDFYKGTFDAAFIAFHQFFDRDSIDPKLFEGNRWPDNPEFRKHSSAISWREVLDMTEIASLAELDVGLRTSINALYRRYQNQNAKEKLRELDDKVGLPNEGMICPFVEGKLLTALLSIEENWLWIGDEFCSERKLWWVEDLLKQDEILRAGCSFTPDKSILITTHWDSHCTFVCGEKSKLEKLIKEANVEGFFCNEKTEVYWGLQEQGGC